MPFRVVGYNKPIDDSSLAGMRQSVLDLVQWTTYEFQQIASALVSTEADKVWNTAPPKPRTGTQAYADGVHWNPGAGEGFYEYTSAGVWSPMFSTPTSLATCVRTVKVQGFGTAGTFTYTPSAGMLYCMIECVGGGGGGGGAQGTVGYALGGGGGGAGAYAKIIVPAATIGASQTVTVGAAGAASAPGGNGGNGGTSSVGSICSASGGSGGSFMSPSSANGGGAGGSTTTGTIGGNGNPGGWGTYANITGVVASGGLGGGSVYGGGGMGGIETNGSAGTSYGAGGGGGAALNAATNTVGGAGVRGVVFITEFCNQ